MPELDDLRSLVPFNASEVDTLDLVPVYDASTNMVKKLPKDEILGTTSVLRAYRALDGTELPKTRVVVDRGDADDEDNQDYLALLFTQNLNWETNTRDDLTLPAARLGLEYNYGSPIKVMEINLDLLEADGTVVPRCFNMVFPLDSSRGTVTLNADVDASSLTATSIHGSTGYALDVAGATRIQANSGGGDNLRIIMTNTHTGHNGVSIVMTGSLTGNTASWIFGLDVARTGTKDLQVRDGDAPYAIITTIKKASGNFEANVGDVEATTIGKGFILKSPDGTRYRLTVANGGALSAVAV